MSRARRVGRWVPLLACLTALGGLTLFLVQRAGSSDHGVHDPLVGAAWVVFGLAAWLVRKVALKPAVGLILGAGIALQAIACSAIPNHSSDMYRYMWDGQVQAAGTDPYLYPPSSAGVAALRNDFLWAPYTATPGTSVAKYCVLDSVSKDGPAYDHVAGCSKINRTNSPTIYPPVAEAWYTAVYLVAGDDSTTPMQVAMALCALAVTLILLLGLRGLGRDPRLAALWAWCPTAVLEVGNDAHADVLGVLLTLIALLVLARARTEGKAMLGGALLGLALATKLTPIFAFPGVLKRAWQHILVAAGAATIVVYAPHVMAAGTRVVGFFPSYLHEQGYANGTGYAIVGLFVHGKLASLVAAAVMGAVALAVLRYSNPDRPWRGGVVMMATALVVGTPEFEWYSMLLVMLVALDGRAEWLALSAGAYLANDARVDATVLVPHNLVVGYGGGMVIALAGTAIRYLHARRAAARPAGATAKAARPALRPYLLLTGAAMAGRGGAGQPSMEVCDTRTISRASARRGTKRTTAVTGATADLRLAASSFRLTRPGPMTSSAAASEATSGAAPRVVASSVLSSSVDTSAMGSRATAGSPRRSSTASARSAAPRSTAASME